MKMNTAFAKFLRRYRPIDVGSREIGPAGMLIGSYTFVLVAGAVAGVETLGFARLATGVDGAAGSDDVWKIGLK